MPVFTCYRGQHGEKSNELQTHLGCLSFSETESTARIYALEPNDRKKASVAINPCLIKADVEINNPIINSICDPFIDFDVLMAIIGAEHALQFAKKNYLQVENTSAWESTATKYETFLEFIENEPSKLKDYYIETYFLCDDPAFVSLALALGYDGAIHQGSGVSMDELEIKPFSISQVQIIEAKSL